MNHRNSSAYYTPNRVQISKHWKRPKPRVYECNVRDVERFYQESYKDYLDAKDSTQRRDTSNTSSASNDRGREWNLEEAANNFRPEYRRNYRDSSLSGMATDRESDRPSAASSASRYMSQVSSDSADNSRTYRASSLVNQRENSPTSELESIDQRLARLRKLREELGISTDAKQTSSYSLTDNTAFSKTARQSSPVETRTTRTQMTSSSLQNGGSRYGASESSSDRLADKYSSKSESSKYSSNYGSSNDGKSSSYRDRDIDTDSDMKKTRPKVHFGAEDDDDYKYSSSKKTTTRSRAAAAAPSYSGADDDDDEVLSNIRKKFPSSDEIMERIKKMEVDI